MPTCPTCRSEKTHKHGRQQKTNAQRWRCMDCGVTFQGRYRNKAYRPRTAKRIELLTDAGLSVRQVAAKLAITPTTAHKYRKQAVEQYRHYLAQPYPLPSADLHIVTWSGGKDSSALLVWALQNIPRDRLRVVFCDTGWEAKTTYRFLDDINAHLLNGSLIVLRSDKYDDLIDLSLKRKRFPSTKARFCTEELKIIPMIKWILAQTCNLAVYQGIRARESALRAVMKPSDNYFAPQVTYANSPTFELNGQTVRRRRPALQKEVMAWLQRYQCSVERPLFWWKAKDVIALCREHEVLNPLYDMGHERVGCYPCIMARKQEIKAIAENSPERIEQIISIEQQTGHTFFPYSKVPDSQCEEPTIRDVVRWASTSGHDTSPPDTPCMSHFGACG